MKQTLYFGRTTPFVLAAWLWLAAFAASGVQPTGSWLFVDDASGIEVAPCPLADDGLCGNLVTLPKSAESLATALRRQLCGLTLLGSLKTSIPGKGERLRLDGWVVDPEDLAHHQTPRRYSASLILLSQVGARLDVRGPLGIVLESHRLMRPVAVAPACE